MDVSSPVYNYKTIEPQLSSGLLGMGAGMAYFIMLSIVILMYGYNQGSQVSAIWSQIHAKLKQYYSLWSLSYGG